MKELNTIQCRLSVPKGRRNNFAKYDYRTCEDIYAAVKPLLEETGCTLTVSDFVELIGDKFYMVATATLENKDGMKVSATGYAREADSMAGMTAPQVTGAASSYARKRALGGLFSIDDTRDVDSIEHPQAEQKKQAAAAAPVQAQQAATAMAAAEMEEAAMADLFRNYALHDFKQARTKEDLDRIVNNYPTLHHFAAFRNAYKARSEELGIEIPKKA